jgi:hypothetical protein
MTKMHGRRLRLMVLLAVAFLVLAQAADYLTFLVMVDHRGLAAERNPIVVALAREGLWVLPAAKAAAVIFLAGTFFVSRLRRPRMARLTLGLGIGVGVIGALSNMASL